MRDRASQSTNSKTGIVSRAGALAASGAGEKAIAEFAARS